MQHTKAVGIRELKDKLSAFLRDVRTGTRLLVLDRGEVVGEISRPNTLPAAATAHPILAQWARDGQVVLASGAKQVCPALPAVRVPTGTAQRLLGLDRGP